MAASLHIIDYCIIVVVIVLSFSIGMYHAFRGRKQNSPGEYLTGGRRMSTLPITLSLVVSFLSGIIVLGSPAEMYTRGTQLYMRTLGYCLSCVISSIFIVPLFYLLKVTSSFEYLEKRFNSKVTKLLGTISMLFDSVFYMGLMLYTPASAISASTDLPLFASILCVALITTVYTALGGLRGVVWTDVFQAVVMVSGMVLIVVKGLSMVGGFGEMWRISDEGGRITFFDFNPDPTKRLSFWSAVIGGTFSTLSHFGVGQVSVQRYCSLPTLKKAQLSILLNIPGLIIMNSLTSMVGLVIYAFYASLHCDPIRNGEVKSSNQLVPFFILNQLNYPGLPGALIAVLLSGTLSSMSSTLNSCAAVTWQDLLSDHVDKIAAKKKRAVRTTKSLKKIIENEEVFFSGNIKIYGNETMNGSGVANGSGMMKISKMDDENKMAGGDNIEEGNKMADKTKASIIMILVGLYGIVAMGMAFMTQILGQHVWQASISFSGATTGPALGMFLLGGLFPFANYKGAISGSLIASVFCLWLSIGAFIHKPHQHNLPTSISGCHGNHSSMVTAPSMTTNAFFNDTTTNAFGGSYKFESSGLDKFYEISFLWYSVIGCVTTVIIGVVVSLVFTLSTRKQHQRHSNSISGAQTPSEALKQHQRHSNNIRGAQTASEALKQQQRRSNSIRETKDEQRPDKSMLIRWDMSLFRCQGDESRLVDGHEEEASTKL